MIGLYEGISMLPAFYPQYNTNFDDIHFLMINTHNGTAQKLSFIELAKLVKEFNDEN